MSKLDVFEEFRTKPDVSVRLALEELAKVDPYIFTMYYRRLRGRTMTFDVAKEIGDPAAADAEIFGEKLSDADREKKALLLRHRPFMVQPLCDQHPHKSYQKSRQAGFTELCVTETIQFLYGHDGTKWIYCLPDDAEVLTRNGWKTKDQIKPGDEALSLDAETYVSSWEPITEVAEFDWDGDLPAIGPFHCTPNHRWPVERRKMSVRTNRVGPPVYKTYGGDRTVMEAKDIPQHLYRIPRLAPHQHDGSPSVLSPRLAAILGWLVTDGHQQGITGYVYQSRTKYLAAVEKLLGAKGTPSHEWSDDEIVGYGSRGGPLVAPGPNGVRRYWGGYVVKVDHADMVALRDAGYNGKEDLPRIVTHLSPEAATAMWEAMMLADGTRHSKSGRGKKHKSTFFAKDSKQPHVQDAFQILCALTERYANITSRGLYVVDKDSKKAWLKPAGWNTPPRYYKGKVWCPRVPTKGTIYIRYKGMVTYTGQTFPRDKQLVDFSTTRLSEALNESPRMRGLFGIPNQIYTKRIGTNSFLFMRSAWESNLGEGVDADGVTFDEKDRMQDQIEVAFEESLSSSKYHFRRDVSTPSLPGRGVNATYEKSCQFEWHVKCLKCGLEQTIEYPENVIQMMDIPLGAVELPRGAYAYRCRRDSCRGHLDRLHGRWIAKYPEKSLVHGYQISQLICPWISATEVMQKLIKYKFKQLWFNYVLGRTSAGDNILLTDEDFNACIAGYEMVNTRSPDWDRITVGIDWGHMNWVVVVGQNAHNGKKYILNIGVFEETADPFQLVRDVTAFIAPFEPDLIIPDAGYGKDRNSYLLKKFPRKVFSCYYNPSEEKSRTFNPVWSEALSKVLVDRTMSLKNMCRALKEREVGFPAMSQKVDLLMRHVKALVPMKEEIDGELVETVSHTGPDHLAHSLSYSLIGFEKLETCGNFSVEFI